MIVPCDCERGDYDDEKYSTCYDCYRDRRDYYVDCIYCDKWHDPRYPTCYSCRQTPGRDEAGRDLRLMILARDQFTCRECGDGEGHMQVDHIKPCAEGGTADPWNLQTLCGPCNREKGRTWWVGSIYWDDYWQSVQMYASYLYEYLNPAEQMKVRDLMDDWLMPRQGVDP